MVFGRAASKPEGVRAECATVLRHLGVDQLQPEMFVVRSDVREVSSLEV
jgi:hypothetical protein